MRAATADFESRSTCSIRSSGSWKYSLDPTTEVLCLAFRLPNWREGTTALWHPEFSHLDMPEEGIEDLVELWDWIADGGLVESHNSFFEAGIWNNLCVPRHGWPVLPTRQRRCSAAKAAAHALPRGLEDAGEVLGLTVVKDVEAAKAVRKMWAPRKPLKSERMAWGRVHAPCSVCAATGKVKGINPETGRVKQQPCGRCSGNGYFIHADIPEMPVLWHESKELFQQLFDYCRQDILAEEAISQALPDLSAEETEVYILDQIVNERGFHLDTAAIDTALALVDEEFADLNSELAELTGGAVTKASQRARMMAWLATVGCDLADTTADTVAATLEGTKLTPAARRGLEILAALGRSSTAKYQRMQDWVCPDSRVHGGLLYHGASTGRWTGAGVQPQNFPRGVVKDPVTHKAPDPDLLWAFLSTRDRELITAEYGSVLGALSSGLRGAIAAPPGRELFVADFNAIETRVLFWLADQQDGLDIFRNGRDIYNEFGTSVFRYEVDRKDPKFEVEGKASKAGVLGLGFGCGSAKFVDVALTLGGIVIPEDIYCVTCGVGSKEHSRRDHKCKRWVPDQPEDTLTSVKVVNAYRQRFTKVVQAWRDYGDAAICATRSYREVECGKVSWQRVKYGDFLMCELPSGRRIAYPEPRVRQTKTPWGKEVSELSFSGISTFTRQWSRQKFYGGLGVQNATQSVARDLMAAALVRIYQSGVYCPVLTVHDEGVAEAPAGEGDVHMFEHLMAAVPDWAPGLPIAAEGYGPVTRYRK